MSSAEAVYGIPLALPGQAQGPQGVQVDPPPPIIAARTQSYAEVAMGKPTILETADFLYVRRGPAGSSFSRPTVQRSILRSQPAPQGVRATDG